MVLFFCQESCFLMSLLFVLHLISAAIRETSAVSVRRLTQREKTDPPGLTVGLARTGTVSEGGHSGFKKYRQRCGGPTTKKVSFQKKLKTSGDFWFPRNLSGS